VTTDSGWNFNGSVEIKRFGNVTGESDISDFWFYFCSHFRYFAIVRVREEGIIGIAVEVGNALVSAPPNRLAVSKSTIARIRTWNMASAS